ncbi:SDR family oxidoreductase [Fuerstiella marisgermanici]|uniref:Levodione reductase n=1 Tax=Fuerstiella marisgermanici TaxID=1891926 RepID=A0A1P8WDV8_9PLAN|nr:SDR family NAD(P)-dependent oxidoreductase [Fuerstiella marisgermanici]APZ92265.1 Levodione reductase [Fuerstiella marisgermanici]
MQISLNGKVAWVTGGSSGVGKAIALEAARCGAKVAITALKQDKLNSVVDEIQQLGTEAMATVADVSQPDQVRDSVEAIINRFGRIDCVYANAGTNGKWAPLEDIGPDEWAQTIAVNLTGTYHTVHFALAHLRKAGGGSIVITSSVNGTRMFSNEGASAYASSKAGQLALGQMLALELAPSKIRVNVICPGAITSHIHERTEKENLDDIETPVIFPDGKIPLTSGKMGEAQQVANLAVFLASDSASHITGTPVWIDGAQSLLQG